MQVAGPMQFKLGQVPDGTVADVAFEAVFGVVGSSVSHVLIAGDLGHDTGGADCRYRCVSFYDSPAFGVRR